MQAVPNLQPMRLREARKLADRFWVWFPGPRGGWNIRHKSWCGHIPMENDEDNRGILDWPAIPIFRPPEIKWEEWQRL
jgi:hypothetical protein